MESVRDIRSQKPRRSNRWSLSLVILQTGMDPYGKNKFSSKVLILYTVRKLIKTKQILIKELDPKMEWVTADLHQAVI